MDFLSNTFPQMVGAALPAIALRMYYITGLRTSPEQWKNWDSWGQKNSLCTYEIIMQVKVNTAQTINNFFLNSMEDDNSA